VEAAAPRRRDAINPGRHCGFQTRLKVLLGPDTPASVRVRAAEVIANHSRKAIEIEDVEARVTAVEEAASEQGKRRSARWLPAWHGSSRGPPLKIAASAALCALEPGAAEIHGRAPRDRRARIAEAG
jgi:hypothetical protein